MESKFKEGLYRLTLLLTASTVLLLALMPHSAPARVILVLSGLGMGSVGLGYRRLPALPDSAAPIFLAVLLTTLLWLAPEQHAMWLWGWAAVIAMPQPVLLLLLHSLLAASCLWQSCTFPTPRRKACSPGCCWLRCSCWDWLANWAFPRSGGVSRAALG